MENKARFDLNSAIESWHRELAAQSPLTPEVRRELEAHLRDAMAELRQSGLNEEEAFLVASRRVGRPAELGEEFGKSTAAVSAHAPAGFKLAAVPGVEFLSRWWHPLLVFSCNSTLLFAFLPGRPALWMILTVLGALFCLPALAAGRPDFSRAKSATLALLSLALVVVVTACFSGGGSMRYGSVPSGGWRYLELLLGIALYFVVSSVGINRQRAGFYAGLFFLPALAGLIGCVHLGSGPVHDLLGNVFPADTGAVYVKTLPDGTGAEYVSAGGAVRESNLRPEALALPATALLCFLLARFGARGVLDVSRPWRILLFAVVLAGCVFSGMRTMVMVCLLIFLAVFWLEGLFRTRFAFALAIGAALALMLAPNVGHLPAPARRALSFLPGSADPEIRAQEQLLRDTRSATWKKVLPTVPAHLLQGKGYAVAPDDQRSLEKAAAGGTLNASETLFATGDFHNGPLSVLLPFGIPGAAALVWFLVAAGLTLHRNYAHGDPELRAINRLLFACFLVSVVRFVFLFGSLYSDMALFAGLLGLGMSVNGGTFSAAKTGTETTSAPELLPENIRARLA